MQQAMQQVVRNYRGMLLFRGIIAILFGVLAIVWPNLTLAILVLLFGVFALISGVAEMIVALGHTRDEGWALLLVTGILSVLAGGVALVWPGITALVFLYLLAAWAIVTGIMEIIGALAGVGRGWLLGLAGLVSIIFGILIARQPAAGLLAVVWLIGVYAIVFGILSIGQYFQTRSLASGLA